MFIIMNYTDLTDAELLRYIMAYNSWTQAELAARLGLTQGAISQLVNEQTKMRSAVRKLAEFLAEHPK